MIQSSKRYLIAMSLATLLMLGGCAKKQAAPPPPPPPQPAAPSASISANPDSVQAGQSTTLSWHSENATEVNIDGIGKVDANGSQQVSPTASTTYRLIAKGPGGTQEATARVTVTQAPPPQVSETDEEMFARNIKDIYFDYDKYDVRTDAQATINATPWEFWRGRT